MRPVSAQISIDASREEIFAVLSDMAARPGFTGHFQEEFHLLRENSTGIGAGGRFRIGSGAGARWMESVITEIVAPHRIEERGKGGRNHRVLNFTVWELVEAASGVDVKVVHWTEAEHPGDRIAELRLSARGLQRNWAEALRRLKDAVETGQPGPLIEVAGGPRLPH